VGVVAALTEWRARRWLSALAARLGAEGMAVAGSVPGLVAAVDQHAADVRDILAQGPHAEVLSDRVLLAAYGRGLLDRYHVSMDQVGCHATGRWTNPDWLPLRLLAVHALSRSTGRSAAGPHPGHSPATH
jgi:Family of unknown function (DUF6401)